MASRILDPQLGTLIKIEEVSQITGIPKATIRLWRQDKYNHLAKFHYYTNAASNAAWYRLADVEAWLEANGIDSQGNRSMFVKVEAPNAFEAPIEPITPMDAKTHLALTKIAKITTANWRKTQDKLFTDQRLNQTQWSAALKVAVPEITEYWFKQSGTDYAPFVHHFGASKDYPSLTTSPAPEDKPRADFVSVAFCRYLVNELDNLGLSSDQILATPIHEN